VLGDHRLRPGKSRSSVEDIRDFISGQLRVLDRLMLIHMRHKCLRFRQSKIMVVNYLVGAGFRNVNRVENHLLMRLILTVGEIERRRRALVYITEVYSSSITCA
jgi:hypothetical protein